MRGIKRCNFEMELVGMDACVRVLSLGHQILSRAYDVWVVWSIAREHVVRNKIIRDRIRG